MIQNVEQTIRDYLSNVIHMSLATSLQNIPWVCEVHYVYDENLNLYFRSTTDRRHSQEIGQNKYVAGNIVMQHKLEDKPRGVYFEGIAEMLTHINEDSVAYQLYCSRFGAGPEILTELDSPTGHQFYTITVNTYYLFDKRESNPSTKYTLEWNQKK
jgi:uncharacterized protein YhbP (UPF0306 family)